MINSSVLQVEENRKKYAQMQEMVDKLQTKIKEQKKMIEEKVSNLI